MNASPRNKSKSNREIALRGSNSGRSTRHRHAPKVLWPALVAINGFGLAVDHASALELKELTVQSTLGQPLRASIAYALAPNEMVQSHCIFLRPAASAAGLPAIRNVTPTASNGVIRLTGHVPVREPILSLNLMVDCPGTANLSREYTVFVDPPTSAPKPAATPTADRAPATVRAARPAAVAQRPVRPAARSTAPIGAGSTYRVQAGDTLSGIAARIEGRDIGLWDAVDVIFAANPDAFIDHDRDRLRAGSVLVLPDMGTVSADVPARLYDSGAQAASQSAAPATAVPAETSASARPAATPPVRQAADPAASSNGAAAPSAGTTATARPAEVSTDPDSPFVSTVEPSDGATSGTFGPAREVIPDTAVDTAVGPAPRVSVAANDGSEGLSSLAWLGGAGIAIILGLLLFGRQLKDRFGSPGDFLPAGIKRGRRRSDVVDQPEPATTLKDDEPTDTFESPVRVQPVALDADLSTGSGLDDDGEIDVAQDFGFSTSHDLHEDLDIELSEAAVREPKETPTDIIPPTRFDDRRFTDTVIVEKEIPPSDDTGEYDLSMIVDATRQQETDVEDTTKDLRAVQVDTGDNEALNGENLTLSRDVDYKILEQDYEEELTATQALNAKLLKEAELAARTEALDATAESEAPTAEYAAVDEGLATQLPDGDPEATAEMPLDQASVTAPESLEDSGVNAEVTTELPAADNDETLDMDIGSATVDTKKLRAS